MPRWPILRLKYVPTNDRIAENPRFYTDRERAAIARKRDVIAVNEAGVEIARWPWHHGTSKPAKRDRTVMLNCMRYTPLWLN